ncbi:MAG: caspase family protein [Candidatus Viridilinea halotolerans]|uniref:Caspase family protein n=1 Tax=Candidatus Viridilinea halotolerans TaxID=2491704 RepID=A0A426U370_9CHLR|nr:MAG: caspase family protein [Candidatus Viridilinea halotolerans]
MPTLAHQFVARLADDLARNQAHAAQMVTALEQRFAHDRLAAATLLLFASDPASGDLQGRLVQVVQQQLTATELQALLTTLQAATPLVRSRITAADDALIQGSGHRVIAPPGAVDLATSAGQRGRILDSPITVVGAGLPAPPAPSVPPAAPRTPIADPTLSADGIHFSFGHALIIGVGQYRDPGIPNVATTANDARALGNLLRDPQLAAYPDAQVRVLVDAKATRTNILDALSELAQRAVGGTALIFFAGHGEAVDGSYALLPSDADVNRLAATGIDAALFHQLVAKVRSQAKRLVVLLNCCHAGGVGDAVLDASGSLLSGSAPPAEFYRPLAVGSGQVVISSSRPAQKSGARSQQNPQHTTFGAHLLAALRGGVPGDGPAVGVFELFAAICASVPADARQVTYLGAPLQQEPLFYASQLDENLAVALRPGWQGGTLSGDVQHQARRLVELELQIERTGADPALRGERDALLRALTES